MKLGVNQYICISSDEIKLEYTKKVKIGRYALYLGKSCCCTIAANGKQKVALVGYAFDVKAPMMDTQRLCDDLLDVISNGNDGIAYTGTWGGRWVVFAWIADRLIVWQDACGLKQVFYARRTMVDRIVIASQARYIAEEAGYMPDPEAQEYIKQAIAADKEYAWPADATLYEEVGRLLPNHFLREGEKKPIRMEAVAERQAVSENDMVMQIAELLQNGMRAACDRYRLAVTLTAGWDSRLVLSACMKIKERVEIVTLQYDGMSSDHPDLTAAKHLCDANNFHHSILSCVDADDAFAVAYRVHSENAHEYWIQMARSIQDNGYGDTLWVKGSCNEILRNPCGVLHNYQVDSDILCKLFQIRKTRFSVNAVDNWLTSARPYCEKHGYNLLDLFYWEHRMGS